MQGPLFQKILLQENRSFNILKVKRPYFVVPWHFHPEVEIMLVLNGKGTRFVGDSIGNFGPADLVMVGANLAHVWKNSEEHFRVPSKVTAEARVILFKEDCFGREFFSTPELSKIHALLTRASRGLKFRGKTAAKVREQIMLAYEARGARQFIQLISILDTLANTREYDFLCSTGYNQRVQPSDLGRLNGVLDHIMRNFRKPLKLEDVASVANMSETAFCRYFKLRTNKTVIQFINEVRVGHSHKLLLETQMTTDRICYESGFNNVSNFYEQFQRITGMSPLRYRKAHNSKPVG